MKQPTISIVIPYHDMKNAEFFLKRNIDSIMSQTFKDYEIVLTKEGKMAENTNAGIKRARGEYIKVLYLDDYFAHPDALKDIIDNFTDDTDWLITGTDDNPEPVFTFEEILNGNNKLGSPSALTIRNSIPLLFDENMSWLLDCHFYYQMWMRTKEPKIIKGVNVILGKHDGQMTHILTDEEKSVEVEYLQKKYE